ncbi:MAG: hypothetical protein MUF66_05495 [Gammaproteobacteria bacterium]|nr:hypothetical protein [Chromatiaceae bacterium]MCU0935524.1 hypothetical protein [Gammaproteobacteria bacterium]
MGPGQGRAAAQYDPAPDRLPDPDPEHPDAAVPARSARGRSSLSLSRQTTPRPLSPYPHWPRQRGQRLGRFRELPGHRALGTVIAQPTQGQCQSSG